MGETLSGRLWAWPPGFEGNDPERVQGPRKGIWCEMKRPPSIVWGVILLWLSLATGVAKGITTVSTTPAETVLAGITDPVVFVATVLAGVVALVSFLVSKISSGRNWARITLLVLLVIDLPFGPWSDALTISQIGMEIVGTVLLFVPTSNEWFRLMRASRLADDLQKLSGLR